jgi:hypothetical protein
MWPKGWPCFEAAAGATSVLGQKETLSSQHHFTSACSQKRTSQRLGYPWLRHGGPHAGVIGTRLYESHPPRYEYFLTDKGMALEPVLKALYTWGGRHG